MRKIQAVVVMILIFICKAVLALDFSGTYTLSAQGDVVTLELRQDERGNLRGTLSDTTGATFKAEGKADEGFASGTFSGPQGKAYFEAELEGNELTLDLIEPGENGIPDFSKVRQLVFQRSGSKKDVRPDAKVTRPLSDEGREVKDRDQGAQSGLAGAAPSGQERLVRGKYCTWGGSSSSSSSYGRSSWAFFDGQGRFTYGSEASFSSGAGMAYGGGADGRGTYTVQGNAVQLRFEDGSSGMANIFERFNDGTASGLKYDGALYSPKLCD